jgi:hypothetical protein
MHVDFVRTGTVGNLGSPENDLPVTGRLDVLNAAVACVILNRFVVHPKEPRPVP